VEKIRVLLVDDEPDILELLQYSLEKEDFQVFTTTSPDNALAIAQDKKPHIIVLDLMMPDMDGIDLCKAMRKMPEAEEAIIVFLSALQEDFTQLTCYQAGGNDYIAKPIRPKLLCAKLRSLYAMKHGTQQNQAHLQIIAEKYAIVVAGKEQILPKKEFEILLFLRSKKGSIVRREKLLEKVWGEDFVADERTLDVHIARLREKIGKDNIKTIKGVGYQWNE
jgi:two-component system alkaline phosphatase synthesis response regulator PhoP